MVNFLKTAIYGVTQHGNPSHSSPRVDVLLAAYSIPERSETTSEHDVDSEFAERYKSADLISTLGETFFHLMNMVARTESGSRFAQPCEHHHVDRVQGNSSPQTMHDGDLSITVAPNLRYSKSGSQYSYGPLLGGGGFNRNGSGRSGKNKPSFQRQDSSSQRRNWEDGYSYQRQDSSYQRQDSGYSGGSSREHYNVNAGQGLIGVNDNEPLMLDGAYGYGATGNSHDYQHKQHYDEDSHHGNPNFVDYDDGEELEEGGFQFQRKTSKNEKRRSRNKKINTGNDICNTGNHQYEEWAKSDLTFAGFQPQYHVKKLPLHCLFSLNDGRTPKENLKSFPSDLESFGRNLSTEKTGFSNFGCFDIDNQPGIKHIFAEICIPQIESEVNMWLAYYTLRKGRIASIFAAHGKENTKFDGHWFFIQKNIQKIMEFFTRWSKSENSRTVTDAGRILAAELKQALVYSLQHPDSSRFALADTPRAINWETQVNRHGHQLYYSYEDSLHIRSDVDPDYYRMDFGEEKLQGVSYEYEIPPLNVKIQNGSRLILPSQEDLYACAKHGELKTYQQYTNPDNTEWFNKEIPTTFDYVHERDNQNYYL